jgi:hypothetical protein
MGMSYSYILKKYVGRIGRPAAQSKRKHGHDFFQVHASLALVLVPVWNNKICGIPALFAGFA